MQHEPWHAQQDVVNLALARLSAVVDPARPALGIHELRVDAQPLRDARLLEVALGGADKQPTPHTVDVFRRGGDLVVTYADQPHRDMRTQVYWRAGSHAADGALAAIELVLSVETSLLDSSPSLTTRSQLVAEEALILRDVQTGRFEPLAEKQASDDKAERQPAGYLFRLPGGKLSYAEMVHPGDTHVSRCEAENLGAGGRVQLGHQLFSERLEKGVILRARVLGLLVDRAGDERAAARHFGAFVAAELPLTT